MKTAKTISALVAMLVLGVAGFWALAALVEYRMGQPVALKKQLASEAGLPFDNLAKGLRESVQSAGAALQQGRRSDAAGAIDAAKRAAEVARDAGGAEFSLKQIKKAQLALQDGNSARAREILAQVSMRLHSSIDSAPATPGEPRSPSGYEGATVLNARGVRIGEVESMNENGAEIVIGGKRDLLGFIDLAGGRRIEVPLDGLVLGKRKSLGSTMVVLPVFSVEPDQVAAESVASSR